MPILRFFITLVLSLNQLKYTLGGEKELENLCGKKRRFQSGSTESDE